MNQPLAIRRLYWKELRQLVPLFGIFVAMMLAMHLFFASIDHPNVEAHWLAYLGLPIVYSMGLGVLTVSQEKESNSLRWLRSLPIVPANLLHVKLVSAATSLLAIWALSYGIYCVFCMVDATPITQSFQISYAQLKVYEGYCLVWSAFLFFAGIATSWRCRSTLGSLFYLLALSLFAILLPWFLREVCFHVPPETTLAYAINFGVPVALSIMIGWTGWTFGTDNFLAQSAAGRGYNSDAYSEVPTIQTDARDLGTTKLNKLYTKQSALIWQAYRLNQPILIVTLLSLIATAFSLLFDNQNPEWPLMSTSLFSALLVGWMGIATFHADAMRIPIGLWTSLRSKGMETQHPSSHAGPLNTRIRFLAERGIAPGLVWWTRSILPLGVLVLGSLAIAFASKTIIATNFHGNPGIDSDAESTLLVVSLGLFALYSVNQWFGQALGSLGLCLIGSPIVSVMTLSFGYFVLHPLSTHIVWLFPIPIIALLATYFMSRDWLDGRSSWSLILRHAALLILAVGIPLIPSLWDILKLQRLNYAINQQTLSLQSRTSPLSNRFENISDRFGKKLAQLRLDQLSVTDTSSPGYLSSFAAQIELIRQLRKSPRMADQDRADVEESWLIRNLKDPSMQNKLGEQRFRECIEKLPSRLQRDEAREFALYSTWQLAMDTACRELHFEDNGRTLSKEATWRDRMRLRLEVSRYVQDLFVYLQSGGSSKRPATELESISIVGRQWFGKWEEDAESLKKGADQ